MSIHSSLSNPDCTQNPKHNSNENGIDLPADLHSAFDETPGNNVQTDVATGREIIDEELLLQTKLNDLRTKKMEMLNLVKELQGMNKDSDLRHQVNYVYR